GQCRNFTLINTPTLLESVVDRWATCPDYLNLVAPRNTTPSYFSASEIISEIDESNKHSRLLKAETGQTRTGLPVENTVVTTALE
ncbi:unnamed protein product, partial [Amoebophrya sp. A120]